MNFPQPGKWFYGVLPVLFLVVLALGALCVSQPAFFGSAISYRLTLDTDVPLYNATFLIPLPVQNGVPAVGLLNLTPSMFSQPGFNASFISWEGNQYLRLAADTIETKDYWEYQVDYRDRRERMDYDSRGYEIEYQNPGDYPYWVNTRHPLGNETLFFPKYNISVTIPEPLTKNYGSLIYFNPVVSRYQTKIYAAFDAETYTSVHIDTSIEGENSWVETFDAWRGNSYSDNIHASFSNVPRHSTSGWHVTEGELRTGQGKYLEY